MAFYDGLGKRIQQGGQGAIDRTRRGAEVARLNSSINSVEKEAAKKYEELGKAYYEKHAASDTYDNDMDQYFQDIDALMDQIEDYKDQIRALKGIRKCPECGQDVSATAQFCSFCGAKLEPVVSETTEEVLEPEPVEEIVVEKIVVCPSCGAELDEDAVFCTVCGHKVR